MAYTYHYLYKIDVSVVRYFTVYGPAGRPDMSPYIFADKLLKGEELPVFGDGSQSRDFTYVDDIAADMDVTWADISKAKKLLGWESKVGFEEGIERLIKWHQKDFSQSSNPHLA
jgi:nucleoside-diphosphate-sugar epimerase